MILILYLTGASLLSFVEFSHGAFHVITFASTKPIQKPICDGLFGIQCSQSIAINNRRRRNDRILYSTNSQSIPYIDGSNKNATVISHGITSICGSSPYHSQSKPVEYFSEETRAVVNPKNDDNSQQESSQLSKAPDNDSDFLSTVKKNILPIISASFLITSTTVGAGCLVLPEIAEPIGMLPTIGIFLVSYIINLKSSLIIAQIAIKQKQRFGNDTPSSFKEFARVNLQSDAAGIVVSIISLFINACILAFNLNRMGVVGSTLLENYVDIPAATVSTVFSVGLIGLISSQSLQRLSNISSIFVLALFASLGCLLVPGLANVNDPIGTLTSMPDSVVSLKGPIAYAASIILMSTGFQNVVPTLTKLLNYDRLSILITLVGGSAIPIVLYLSWIFCCLGGGVDNSLLDDNVITTGSGLSFLFLSVFSLVTICGSSICGGISMAEELGAFFTLKRKENTVQSKSEPSLEHPPMELVKGEKEGMLLSASGGDSNTKPAFLLSTSITAVGLPLVFTVASFLNENTGDGLTDALAIAGSIGCPLLYGILPAYIAFQQLRKEQVNPSENMYLQQQESKAKKLLKDKFPFDDHSNNNNNLVPVASLPMFGALSTGYVGQELFDLLDDLIVTYAP